MCDCRAAVWVGCSCETDHLEGSSFSSAIKHVHSMVCCDLPNTIPQCEVTVFTACPSPRGIKPHRCRLPGVSTLDPSPFGTSEFRLELVGRRGRGETEGFVLIRSVRGSKAAVDNTMMCPKHVSVDRQLDR